MKFQTYLIKYGEIGIKGKNRYMFEDALVRQIRHSLKDLDGLFHTYKAQGRVYVDCDGDYDGGGGGRSRQYLALPKDALREGTVEEFRSCMDRWLKGDKTVEYYDISERRQKQLMKAKYQLFKH